MTKVGFIKTHPSKRYILSDFSVNQVDIYFISCSICRRLNYLYPLYSFNLDHFTFLYDFHYFKYSTPIILSSDLMTSKLDSNHTSLSKNPSKLVVRTLSQHSISNHQESNVSKSSSNIPTQALKKAPSVTDASVSSRQSVNTIGKISLTRAASMKISSTASTTSSSANKSSSKLPFSTRLQRTGSMSSLPSTSSLASSTISQKPVPLSIQKTFSSAIASTSHKTSTSTTPSSASIATNKSVASNMKPVLERKPPIPITPTKKTPKAVETSISSKVPVSPIAKPSAPALAGASGQQSVSRSHSLSRLSTAPYTSSTSKAKASQDNKSIASSTKKGSISSMLSSTLSQVKSSVSTSSAPVKKKIAVVEKEAVDMIAVYQHTASGPHVISGGRKGGHHPSAASSVVHGKIKARSSSKRPSLTPMNSFSQTSIENITPKRPNLLSSQSFSNPQLLSRQNSTKKLSENSGILIAKKEDFGIHVDSVVIDFQGVDETKDQQLNEPIILKSALKYHDYDSWIHQPIDDIFLDEADEDDDSYSVALSFDDDGDCDSLGSGYMETFQLLTIARKRLEHLAKKQQRSSRSSNPKPAGSISSLSAMSSSFSHKPFHSVKFRMASEADHIIMIKYAIENKVKEFKMLLSEKDFDLDKILDENVRIFDFSMLPRLII
jgi:hypothetical protein